MTTKGFAENFRLGYLLASYALVGLCGVQAALGGRLSSREVILTWLLGGAIAMTSLYDCEVHGLPLPKLAVWGIVFTWPLSVPALMVWTRGPRGVALALGHAALLALVAFVAQYLALCLTFGRTVAGIMMIS